MENERQYLIPIILSEQHLGQLTDEEGEHNPTLLVKANSEKTARHRAQEQIKNHLRIYRKDRSDEANMFLECANGILLNPNYILGIGVPKVKE